MSEKKLKDAPRTKIKASEIGRSGVDWHHSATMMQRHAIALECELQAMTAHAAALRRMLNHHHAKASEECEVYFKDDVDKFGVVERGTTDLGRAYEESDLCERTIAVLTDTDAEAIERERKFQEAQKTPK